MAAKPLVTLRKSRVAELRKTIERLARTRLMVGIPKVASPRTDGKFTNAEIGYVQENGAPEANIPPRPHLKPTAAANRALVAATMRRAAAAAFSGDGARMDAEFEGLGLTLVAKVKQRIRAGIPPPLAASTVAGRIARRKSKSWKVKRRALIASNVADPNHPATEERPGVGVFTPLIDTGDYIAHITYTVRDGKKGRDRKVGPIGGAPPPRSK